MNFSLLIASVFLASLVASKPATVPDVDPFDLDLFTGAMGDGHFANFDVDGVETIAPKKSEKLPGQKKMKAEFQQPEGVVPEFTGSFVTSSTTQSSSDEDTDEDYFGESSASGAASAITNPASTYLAGADFEKIEQPKCQMLGCTGPIPNDGSYATMSASLDNKACNQIFVALNGCTDNKGYPMGMLCSVCCDCANSFVSEMKKTFGYKSAIPTSTFTA